MSDTAPATLPVPPPPHQPVAGDTVTFSWAGTNRGLIKLGLINFLLTVVTLGIYHFWGKTEVRRRIANSIRVNGEPLEYTGTGWELFSGFLLVLLAILVPIQLIGLAAVLTWGPQASFVFIFFVPLLWYLFHVAIYRARRYRRSRLRWRGVRGSLIGSSWSFGWHSLWSSIVSNMTYGWLSPWRDNFLHRTLTSETRFGDRPFQFTGKAGTLYSSFAIAWIGTIGMVIVVGGLAFGAAFPFIQPVIDATEAARGVDGHIDWTSDAIRNSMGSFIALALLGVASVILYSILASVLWSLYYAQEYRYFASQTTLEGLRFGLDVKGWSMLWLFVSNTLMSALTLTILGPLAEARVARYFVQRLSANGRIDFAAIQQSEAKLSRTGEGLAEAFDVEGTTYFILSI
jgi:uncharacterized membrane protein YjgN (DUF898 family)